MRHLKLLLRTVLSLAMSALFIWLSLRHTDLRAVGRAMADASRCGSTRAKLRRNVGCVPRDGIRLMVYEW